MILIRGCQNPVYPDTLFYTIHPKPVRSLLLKALNIVSGECRCCRRDRTTAVWNTYPLGRFEWNGMWRYLGTLPVLHDLLIRVQTGEEPGAPSVQVLPTRGIQWNIDKWQSVVALIFLAGGRVIDFQPVKDLLCSIPVLLHSWLTATGVG